jgi:hypothetical protein
MKAWVVQRKSDGKYYRGNLRYISDINKARTYKEYSSVKCLCEPGEKSIPVEVTVTIRKVRK